jgi:3',5'-cyclic AMP phosphodiesterase CpdA
VRIAHISDLHVIALDGAVPFRLLNKRLTGYVNLKLVRSHMHQLRLAQAVAREVRRGGFDHVVITGDLTNLALEQEFERARTLLEEDLGSSPDAVSIVPGNHDVYTHGAHRSRRFDHYLGRFASSDLPGLGGVTLPGAFPFVRLRGPVAIIGLCSALPRPPLVASGVLGAAQREALARILAHPEVQTRTPIILQHHPPHNPASRSKTLLEGLWDAPEERALLACLTRGLMLHGHLHRRIRRTLVTGTGAVEAVGTSSASLHHAAPDRMAGYNVMELDERGQLSAIAGFRLNLSSGAFERTSIPCAADPR